MYSNRLIAISTAMLIAVGASGCGPENTRQAVSGTVLFRGEPLDKGSLTFLTIDPPGPAGGALIENGQFRVSADMGLLPGIYKVSVSSPKGVGIRTPEQMAAGASTPAKEQIAAKYNEKTELTIEVVKGGPNKFELKVD